MQFAAAFDDISAHDDGAGGTFEAGRYWELLRCEACRNITLRTGKFHEAFAEDFEWSTLYPVNSASSVDGLPSTIESAWAAAQKVRGIDSNAFGVLTRRVLELVCADKGASGNTLALQLRDLGSKGVVPGTLAELAQNARNFGNIGAHASLGDLSSSEVALLEELAVAVLEYVYSAPLLVARAQTTLDGLKASRSAGAAAP